MCPLRPRASVPSPHAPCPDASAPAPPPVTRARPGALNRFLGKLDTGWNVSLFHYRNHGADVGRVLVGMQVPASDAGKFKSFLGELGYMWTEETDNDVYQQFLLH